MIVMKDMHAMHLGALDLNALVVLDALLATRSVTAAAKQLGLSQSATSHALARLRGRLGDALLVRGAGGLVPTARAQAMTLPLRDALAAMRQAIAPPAAFDPATARCSFVLATADYMGLVLLPALMRTLAASAPGIDVRMRAQDYDLGEQLARGDYDLAIGPDIPGNDRPGIRSRTLFEERFVCLVRRGHPELAKRWTPERFARLQHAFIAPRGRPGGVVDAALAELGLERHVALSLPHFLVAPFVIAQTDLVLTLPDRVARTFVDQLPVAIVEPPLAVPGFSMMLLWHDRVHDDPAQRWLRERIIELVAEPSSRRQRLRAGSPRSGSRPARRGSRRSPSR